MHKVGREINWKLLFKHESRDGCLFGSTDNRDFNRRTVFIINFYEALEALHKWIHASDI